MQSKEFAKTNFIPDSVTKIISNRIFGILSFSILTALAAQITIPVKPVPFTLQTMVVIMAGAFLGAKNGFFSQVVYLAAGMIGLPVFAQIPDGAFGFARLAGPTGGYLLAFPFAAYAVGYFTARKNGYFSSVVSMFLGELIILSSGTLFLWIFYVKYFLEAVNYGAAVFSFWSILKLIAAAGIYSGITANFRKTDEGQH